MLWLNSTYKIWEFFAIAKNELFLTTIVGISAVSLVSVLLIPHWTAVFYLFPLVAVLYVDLLGVMHWAGNAVSFVTLAMSIGLLVDFVVHVLFRYYEESGTREEKTAKMLRSMGSSVMMGGMTTLLGTLPLMFCSSSIFQTVFKISLGIVTLGLGHGLILAS